MSTSIATRLYADHRTSRRIDYGSTPVIRARAEAKQRQRARAAKGSYVVGRFVLRGSTVLLEAIAVTPAWNIEPGAPLTLNFHAMYRWCTRQAARQWLLRNPDPRCQPVNLEQLRGRELPDEPGPVVAATTRQAPTDPLSPRQPAGGPDVPGQMTLADFAHTT